MSNEYGMDRLGPSINYALSSRKRGGDRKLPILLCKKTTKRWRGSKIDDFETI